MATGVQNAWSVTAASNATADSTINMREGQAPSTLNDSVRNLMAAVKKWVKDWQGGLVTGGIATAYTLTTIEGLTLADGMRVACRMSATNGAAATLNVDGNGAVAIQSAVGTAAAPGGLLAGAVYEFTYYAAGPAWLVGSYPTLPAASETVAGLVELATDAETQTGTDTARAITPANLAARTATEARAGVVELATTVEAAAGTDTARAVTAAGVKSYVDGRPASETVAGVAELATEAEMETGTDAGRIVVPGKQKHHPLHPKAFGKVSAAGSAETGAVGFTAVRDSTGNYTLTLSPAMANTDFTVIATPRANGCTVFASIASVSSVIVTIRTSGGGAPENNDFAVLVLGTQ